ncbi:MAG: chromate transporter, partial [Actinobacteria bacterium]|nr:chromate transporter [Actinomycetota bacterium]
MAMSPSKQLDPQRPEVGGRIGIRRLFTEPGTHPYGQLAWERRTSRITNYRDGTVAFEQRDVEVPVSWSLNATNILAQKYFRGIPGTPERETSLRQVADRVVDTIAGWGVKDGYFADADEASAFADELKYLIISQRAAFNSPVWFNIGAEGRKRQASACFILSVDDTMDSILNWYVEEGTIFKGGSGAGVNLSRIRSSKEHLKGGGTASGPVSFMRGADASATPPTAAATTGPVRDLVPFRDAVRAWFAISLQTFGGPAGQIAVMHRELVEERRWFGEGRFLHALSYCTLLPGPEAQQLAIYLGWLLNGTLGGLIAGILFVLPGFVAIMGLSVLYAGWGDTLAVAALFAGLAPAVLAIVAHAVVRVSRRALRNPLLVGLAIAAFVALAAFAVPFPLVVVAAGALGFLLGRSRPDLFAAAGPQEATAEGTAPPLIPDDALHGAPPSWRRAARLVVIGVTLWVMPVLVAAAVAGGDSIFVDLARFFGGAALVTFGGAYAVLAYVAQQAVEVYGWLSPGEMITGLAMAETTPGPLIQVVQFVGFMGA